MEISDLNRDKFNEYRRKYFKTERGRQKHREHSRKNRNTPKGRASHTWYAMLSRAGKKKGYEHVEVKMTKEQFLEWAVPKYEKWFKEHPNVVPSINRLDSKGHYEINNIEMISMRENSLDGLKNARKARKGSRGSKYWFIDGLGI
jgi:hypothetical protein